MANIAVFVPHNGCPNKCSFCDQRHITGCAVQPTGDDVRATLENALKHLKDDSFNSEIAFFGGSFTAVDREYMLELLESTVNYIHRFKGIRVSTRPDAVNEEILSILKEYGVTSIELGAQSMDDAVLCANERGHDSTSVYKASRLISDCGFSLGLQMMTGLYKSTDELDIFTAREFIKLKPDTVRIYPTVVLKNTFLAELFKSGEYIPPAVNDAVKLCAKLIPMFEDEGIKVIRVGLHDSESLRKNMLSGAFHPAFGELCRSRIIYNSIVAQLNLQGISKGKILIYVPSGALSKAVGQKKINRQMLKALGYEPTFLQDNTLAEGRVLVMKG